MAALEEQWCNRDVRDARVVATLDCNGDQREDILSLSPRGEPFEFLGCYTTDGRHFADVPMARWVPDSELRAADLDGDGRKEITYLQLHAGHRFGARHADGQMLAEAQFDAEMRILVANDVPHRRATHARRPRDVVVLGPKGQLLGLSPSGQRWSAGSGMVSVTSIDLDGDGSEEVIGLDQGDWEMRDRRITGRRQHTVSVWTWSRDQHPLAHALRKLGRRGAAIVPTNHPAPLASPADLEPQQPIRPYTNAAGDKQSMQEMDFRHGCYTGVGAVLDRLPALVQQETN